LNKILPYLYLDYREVDGRMEIMDTEINDHHCGPQPLK